MKEKGMGRTRLGRFAAVTIPATVATAGLGFAVLQGMVGASISSATPFQVAGATATGDDLELTANNVSTAADDGTASGDVADSSEGTGTNKKDALVSLKNGSVSDLCMAADTQTPLGTLGLKIQSSGDVSLGSGWTDLSADSLAADSATLPTTDIGYAQGDLAEQAAANSAGYSEGGFSLATDVTDAAKSDTGGISLTNLDVDAYALTLSGLSLNNLSISPEFGSVEGSC